MKRLWLALFGIGLIATSCASDVEDAAPPDETVLDASTTTAAESTTTTTTTTTTTEPPPETECSTDRYGVQLPDGWSHEDCTLLTNADASSQITITVASDESYRDALRSLASAVTVTDASLTTLDGAPAVQMMIGGPGQPSTIYVVDVGEGNLVASGPEPFISEVVAGATITSATPGFSVCSAEPTRSEADVVLNTGEDDVDGDGDLETFALVGSDGLTFVEIDGLAAVEGIVVGAVQFGRTDPEATLGWADWDGDGLPEVITREPAGPAFGDVHHVHSINGCETERVATLVNDMRAGSSDIFVCDRDENGVLRTLTTMLIRQTPEVSPAEITNRTTTSLFTSGVSIPFETQVTVTNDPADLDPPIDGPVNLASCATLF